MTDTPTTAAQPPRHCIACGSPSGSHLSWCPALTIRTTTPVTGGVVQQTGWLCPACGGGNAPFVQRCPCKGWLKMEITC